MIFTLEIRPPGDGPPDDVTVTAQPNEEHATCYIISISQERREKWAQKMEKEGWGSASRITDAQVLMGFRDAFLGLVGVPPVGPASAEQAEAWMLAIGKAMGVYVPHGGMWDSLGRAVPAVKSLATLEFMDSDDPWDEAARDVDAILTAAGLFNENAASAVVWLKMLRDAAGVAKNVIDD